VLLPLPPFMVATVMIEDATIRLPAIASDESINQN
jgi:hypothetical protein